MRSSENRTTLNKDEKNKNGKPLFVTNGQINTVSLTNSFYSAKISGSDFTRLGGYITENYGIQLPITKKVMVESRLQKRLHALNMFSFNEYCDFIFSPEGKTTELTQVVNLLTTNKTDFFREPNHFNLLEDSVLLKLIDSLGRNKEMNIWSAACSSGEEVYTLAIVLSEYAKNKTYFDFRIQGTDISTSILRRATTAVYPEETVTVIPDDLKKKYFLQGKNKFNKTVRIGTELRSKTKFDLLNLMDEYYNVNADFDIIFCRNVLIYFDGPTQEKVVNKLYDKLKSGGYLFLGHADTILDVKVPLVKVKPSVYMKP